MDEHKDDIFEEIAILDAIRISTFATECDRLSLGLELQCLNRFPGLWPRTTKVAIATTPHVHHRTTRILCYSPSAQLTHLTGDAVGTRGYGPRHGY